MGGAHVAQSHTDRGEADGRLAELHATRVLKKRDGSLEMPPYLGPTVACHVRRRRARAAHQTGSSLAVEAAPKWARAITTGSAIWSAVGDHRAENRDGFVGAAVARRGDQFAQRDHRLGPLVQEAFSRVRTPSAARQRSWARRRWAS